MYTPKGHQRVPIGALLAIEDRVARKRAEGHRRLHHLEGVLQEDRERAATMRPDRYLSADQVSSGHGKPELRGLAYHRAIAERLNHEVVEEAHYRMLKWLEEGALQEGYAAAWLELLEAPIPAIRKAITEDDQRGRDLRQNSPFAGVLSERERRRILEATG